MSWRTLRIMSFSYLPSNGLKPPNALRQVHPV
jgi:hypothetical protein